VAALDPKRHPCVVLAVFYLAGRILTAFLADPAVAAIMAVVFSGVGAVSVLVRRPLGAAVWLSSLALVAGAVHGSADLREIRSGVPFVEKEIIGRVLEQPERSVTGDSILRMDTAGLMLRLKIRPSPRMAEDRIQLLRRGDLVRVWARTGLPSRFANPWSDSPGLALRSAGIDRVGTVKSARLVELLASGPAGLPRWVDEARARLRAGLDRIGESDPQSRGLLGAMLLGDRAGLPVRTVELLRSTGLVHLIAVSGLHVGLILILVLGTFHRLPLPLWSRQFVTPLILGGLILLIGSSASILRAAGMALIAAWGRRLGRGGQPLNSLCAVGLLLVALNPASIHNAGFRLSFAATAGILIGYRPLKRFLPLPAFPGAPLAISIAAYLATAPWTAALFGTVAPVSLLSNLVSAPMCGLILLAGYPAMVLSGLELPTLGTGPMALAACRWLVRMAETTPGAILQVPGPSFPVTAGLLAALPLMACRGRSMCRSILMLPLALSLTCLHLGKLPAVQPRGAVEVMVTDVGQGQAVLVRSAAGSLLVDAGGSRSPTFDVGARVLAPQLAGIGIHRLDILAISHEHLDHAGGAAAILKRFEVGTVWVPPGTLQQPAIRPLVELARRLHVPVVQAGLGTSCRGRGWTLTSLHPGKEDSHLSINDRSLVLRFEAEYGTALIPGDLGQAGEDAIMATGRLQALLDVDLLVAGHHGAAGGSSPRFLAAVSPEVVLVSAGRRNRFGHPDPETVGRFRAAGAAVGSTERDGLLRWRLDRSGWILTGYRSGELAGKRTGR
jgi:competence protein ComEC